MTNLLVPAVYTIKALRKRARNPESLRVIEYVPVLLRDVDQADAPVAIEAMIAGREIVKYRLVNGELYGPAFPTDLQQEENAARINCRNPFLPDDFKALLPPPVYEQQHNRRGAPPMLPDAALERKTALALEEVLPGIREIAESGRNDGCAFVQRVADRCVAIDGVVYNSPPPGSAS